jgi:DNA-binding CsgD family transcriptional regulator
MVGMSSGSGTLPPRLRQAGVTRRQAEVLGAVADRLSNGEIAAQLSISVRTVESHVSSLLAKLQAADRRELATIARTVVVGPTSSARMPLSLLELTERSAFVGRHEELALLRARWEEATSGRRRVVLLLGEAGIGKSRLAAETALVADHGGALVLVGHCDREALVAYQPFVEAMTGLLELLPDAVAASALRRGGKELARLLPGLAASASHGAIEDAGSPEAARYRLYEAVAGLVTSAAHDTPVMLALEDLHWADPPTLQLLTHLVRRADRSRLLVLGTVRTVRPEGAVLGLLGDLRREHDADVVWLQGLDAAEIEALVTVDPGGMTDQPSDVRRRLAEQLHAETEGNPFFVRELLRYRAPATPRRSGGEAVRRGVPATVRDVIVRRVETLDAATRQVMSVAAIVGRRFRLDLVAQASDISPDRFLGALEDAQACGLLSEAADHPAWLDFSHALVRETLENELSPERRRRLHRRVAELLETEDRDGHVAELARHFHAAATPADYEEAVHYACAAAEQATSKLAYERSAELYGQALDALALASTVDLARRFEVLLARAVSYRRAGLLELARQAATDAAEMARQLGDPERIADAALAVGDAAPVWSTDPQLVALLERALDKIDERDQRRGARLLARLAQAAYYSAPTDRRRGLTKQALALAHAARDDTTLASVLAAQHVALWGPADVEERLAIAGELVAVAERLGDQELALQGHAWRLVDLLEIGDVAAADIAISTHARLARDLGQPLHVRDSALWAATRALLDGRFDDAARESQRALALGRRAGDPHAEMFWWAQRYWLVLEQDASTGDMRVLLETYQVQAARYPHVPAWQAKIALLHARLGDQQAAAALAAQLSAERFAELPRDAVWVAGLYYLAEVTAFLGDHTQAGPLYELLLPFAARLVVVDRALLCLGSISRVLGLLAALLADRTKATQHLRDALAKHEGMGARPLAARTQLDLARLLRDDTATTEAAEHLASARATATELGMSRLLKQICALER